LQKATATIESVDMPTASFNATTLCWVHRLLTEDLNLPEAIRGRFRAVQVWIGGPDSTQETARYLPPPPESIPKLVDEWLLWWREQHSALQAKEKGSDRWTCGASPPFSDHPSLYGCQWPNSEINHGSGG
jgi:hypothetical protein